MIKTYFSSYPDVYARLSDMSAWDWGPSMAYVGFCEFVHTRHNSPKYHSFNDRSTLVAALLVDYCLWSQAFTGENAIRITWE